MLKPGDRVAERYVIEAKLGAGAMGVVYSARDERLRRPVAVKVLSSKRVGNPTARARLKREARAAAALDDAGIAQVFDVGDTPDGGAFLVMELVRGKSVRELGAATIERAEALRIVREVARTLGAAHKVDLVHRDVKPDNLMVRENGRVVLLDFGIAKDIGQADRRSSDDPDSVVTAQGAILGTPPYIAPEQIRAKNVGPASDQFALAVVAYGLLTGKKPWEAPSELGLLGQILTAPPRQASDADPSLPPAADAVFAKALAKEPAERFSSVEAFADALEGAVIGRASVPDRASTPDRATPAEEARATPSPSEPAAATASDRPAATPSASPVVATQPDAGRSSGLLTILILVLTVAALAWLAWRK